MTILGWGRYDGPPASIRLPFRLGRSQVSVPIRTKGYCPWRYVLAFALLTCLFFDADLPQLYRHIFSLSCWAILVPFLSSYPVQLFLRPLQISDPCITPSCPLAKRCCQPLWNSPTNSQKTPPFLQLPSPKDWFGMQQITLKSNICWTLGESDHSPEIMTQPKAQRLSRRRGQSNLQIRCPITSPIGSHGYALVSNMIIANWEIWT